MPLRLTLELIPHGDESRKKVMGVLDIENVHTWRALGTEFANYQYCMTGPVHGGGVDVWHEGVLEGIERDRGYWAHVKEILNSVDCESQPMKEL